LGVKNTTIVPILETLQRTYTAADECRQVCAFQHSLCQ
jgi:hypothetical protein